MADVTRPIPASPACQPPFDPAWKKAVIEHASAVLASPAFRASERSRQFLEYVVEHALAGELDLLKERSIGMHVFGRAADYDTGADAIVRVKANEVRKRLNQYYRESAEPCGIVIDLPAGSYLPRFHAPSVTDELAIPAAVAAPDRLARRRWIFPAVLGLAGTVVIGGCLVAVSGWNTSPLDRFWAPVVKAASEPIICVGASETYVISQRLSAAVRQASRNGANATVPDVKVGDLVHVPNFQISLGNFYAVQGINQLLAKKGKSVTIRPKAELSLEDLRGTVISVAAFTNPWTITKNAGLRFYFAQETGSIRDRLRPEAMWNVVDSYPWRKQTIDYGLISRVFGSAPGEVFITAAGVNTFGTQVAGAFLTDPESWRELEPRLPRGWERKNLQIVLETAVVGVTPNPPKVIAFHVW